MNNLFAILFFLSILCLLIGLIKPGIVIRWGNKRTRGRAVVTYLISSITLLILFGMTAPNTSSDIPIKISPQQAQSSVMTPIIHGKWEIVSKVIDGDTVDFSDGEKVRLIGVNTPETVKPDTPVQPYGKEASDFTKSQLEGKKVYAESDVETKDQYGRTLAYLYTQVPKSRSDIEKYMFNAELVTDGYAQVMTIKPDVKYADLFVKLQHDAKSQNKGLWALGIYKDSVTSTNDVFLPGKDPSKQTQSNTVVASKPVESSPVLSTSATSAPTANPAPQAQPKPTQATINIVSVTSPAPRNSTATLVAKVTPGATASIEVDYKSGPSTAAGLEPKQADVNGNVSWSWHVGGRTTLGSWPITVTCNGVSASTSFEVVH